MSLKVWLIHIIGGAAPSTGKGEGRMGRGRERNACLPNERTIITPAFAFARARTDAGPPSPSRRLPTARRRGWSRVGLALAPRDV